MSITVSFLFVGLSYLLGCVPNGVWISRLHGVDIRAVGSRNIGATNVFRSIGKGAGITTFLLDALKGFVPAFLFSKAAIHFGSAWDREVLALSCGFAAIAGHNWSVFAGFKGGKGVATSAGMLLGIAPKAVAFGLGSWAIIFFASGFVSAASISAALITMIFGWILYARFGLLLPIMLSVLALLVIYTHRTNIQRLIKGTENRFHPLRRNK